MIDTRTTSLAAAVVMAAVLGACSSTPVAMSDTSAKSTATAAQSAAANPGRSAQASPAAESKVTTVSLPEYLDPKSALSRERSVYFDFDQYTLDASDTAVIERHGRFLSTHPAVRITIEGNTDERGGSEYNLALGQKRADAVMRALEIQGARGDQLEALSWGESKPKATGNDETSFAENRRADLRYPSK